MTTAVALRQILLKNSAEVAQLYVDAAVGKQTFMNTLPEARTEVWEVIKELVLKADDPLPLAKLTDGDINEKVDIVLNEVAEGKITPNDGKKLMALLQAGFDITELPKLLAKLEEAENET